MCVAYSRHAKVPAVVRTSCLLDSKNRSTNLLLVILTRLFEKVYMFTNDSCSTCASFQSKFPYFVDMLLGRHRRCATIGGIILIEERRMKRHRFIVADR